MTLQKHTRRVVLGATISVCLAGTALADGCDTAWDGLTHIHYPTGRSEIPQAALTRLEDFASVAKYKDLVCVRGIVDAQGGDAARNRQIARSRAFTIKLFLTSRGVPERNIEVVTQNQNFTLFGLLDDDQQADRRVRLTYE